MSLAEDLLKHAASLLVNPPSVTSGSLTDVDLRRAISASYYALFHRLSASAAEQIAPSTSPRTAGRVHRWLNHSDIRRVCQEFAASKLKPPLQGILDSPVSEDMRTVALNFIKLQEARHSADYDPTYEVTWEQAREFVELAARAMISWERTSGTAERSIFVLSMLLWENWKKER